MRGPHRILRGRLCLGSQNLLPLFPRNTRIFRTRNGFQIAAGGMRAGFLGLSAWVGRIAALSTPVDQ